MLKRIPDRQWSKETVRDLKRVGTKKEGPVARDPNPTNRAHGARGVAVAGKAFV